MLRVQVLSGTAVSSSSQSNHSVSELMSVKITASSKDKVYHFSPHMAFSSSPNNPKCKDVLFRIGRQEAEVELTNEKSVSRQHCRIRILSSLSNGLNSDTEVNDFWTKEHRKACDATSDGIIFILQDMGSKFGTRIYYDKSNDPSNAHVDSDETRENDETDDDQQMKMSSVVPFPSTSRSQSNSSSAPSSLYFDTTAQTMKVLEKNGSSILHSLSSLQKDGNDDDDGHDHNNYDQNHDIHSNHLQPTSTSDHSFRSNSVIVQCGMALLLITRIPMEMCTSRISAAAKKKLESVATSIGIVLTNQIHPKCATTHLIAPDQISSAKNISAWLLNIPVITEDYVYAMAEREKGSDPLPIVEDYKCPIVESEFQFDHPATETSKLSIMSRQKILYGYKILNMNDSHPDIENMCRCAGASIVKLYRTVNGKVDMAFWQNEDFFRKLKQQQENDHLELVYFDVVNSRSSKIKKGKAFLSQMAKESWIRLSCIPLLDGAARAIQGVTDLVDVEGNAIARYSGVEEMTTNRNDDQIVYADPSKKTPHPSDTVIDDIEEREIGIRKETNDGDGGDFEIHDEENSDMTSKDDQTGNAPRKRKEISDERNSDLDEEDINQNTSDTKEMHGWTSTRQNSKSKRLKSVSQPSRGWMSSADIQSNDDNHQSLRETNEQQEINRPRNKTTKRDDGKEIKRLQSQDGWLLTAPHGKDRTKLRRSVKDMHDIGEENAQEAAETLHVRLILRSKADVEKFRVTNKHQKVATNTKQKDFKRFVKNSVICGKNEHEFSEIRLISVGANESRRLRELQDEEAFFDEQEKIADDLFGDGGCRKIGNGSIRHFMKPSTNQRREVK